MVEDIATILALIAFYLAAGLVTTIVVVTVLHVLFGSDDEGDHNA